MNIKWLAHIPTIEGKGRPRFGNGRTYTPKATRAYEKTVGALCRIARGSDAMVDGGCVLVVVILDPIPMTWSRKDGSPNAKAIRATMQNEPSRKRPDVDNCLKAITDGAQGVWFKDDGGVLPIPWRGWAPSPRSEGVHIACIEAPTPREKLAVLAGVPDFVRDLLEQA